MIPAWTIRVLSSAKILLPGFLVTPILADLLLPVPVAEIIGGGCVLLMTFLGVLGAVTAVLYFIGGYRFRCPECGGPTDDLGDRLNGLGCAHCGTIRISGLWSYRVLARADGGASSRRPKRKTDGVALAFGIFFGGGCILVGAATLLAGKMSVGKNGSGGVLTPEHTPVEFYASVGGCFAFGLLVFGLLINNARLRRRGSRKADERRRRLNAEKARRAKN